MELPTPPSDHIPLPAVLFVFLSVAASVGGPTDWCQSSPHERVG